MTTPLAELALAWLAGRQKGATAAGLRKALAPFRRQDDAAWTAACAELVDQLARDGLVERRGTALAVTPKGLEVAAPLGAGRSWRDVQRAAVARALGVDASESVGGADGLRAAILARGRALPTGAAPTLAEAKRALAWQLVGVDSAAPVTVDAIVAALVPRVLGGIRVRSAADALALLCASLTGARRATPDELRRALVGRWLDGFVADDLTGFAARVQDAARRAQAGRFGPDKVFIAQVRRDLHDEDEATFKDRLLRAHRAGLVTLSRADLIEAMDPVEVAASEVRYMGASFHFVNV